MKRYIAFAAVLIYTSIFEVFTASSAKIAVIHDFGEGFGSELNAIQRLINKNGSYPQGIELECKVLQLDTQTDFAGAGIFHAGEKLSRDLDIEAVIGPSKSEDVLLFHPHAVLLDVPHIAPVSTDPTFDALDRFPQLIRMQESYKHQISAILDVMTALKWSSLAILSSESDYAHYAGERLREAANNRGIKVLLNRRLGDLSGELDIRKYLNDVRRSGQRVITLICEKPLARHVLAEAVANGMTGDGWAWLLWSDIVDDIAVHTDVLRWGSRYKRSAARRRRSSEAFPDIPGILAVRTSYPKGSLYDEFLNELLVTTNGSDLPFPTVKKLKYVDAVLAAGYGLARKQARVKGTLLDHITSLEDAPGVTEDLTFDSVNRQAKYSVQFEILNSKSGGRWRSVGNWKISDGENGTLILDLEKIVLPGEANEIESFLPQVEFKMFEVVTIQSDPFVNIEYDPVEAEQNEGVTNEVGVRYSGFCIELLQVLSSDLGFQYTIRDLGPNAKFGSRNPVSGYWNGLIGELVSGNADLIVAPITVTVERATVVDTMSSFMETELKFAINRDAMVSGDESEVYLLFSFLRPFSPGLWAALLVSVIAMALYLTLVSRLSPYGAHGRYFQSERGAESSARIARRRSSAYLHTQEILRRRSSVGVVKGDLTSTTDFARNSGNPVKDLGTRDSDGRRVFKRVSFSEQVDESESKDYRARMLGRSLSGPKRPADDADSDEEEAQERQNARRFMSFNNALYFTCAGLLWQSPECVPRAPSARVAAGIWYMAGVIIVASYTANMVAFVTQTSTSNKLDSLEKLLEQRIISPGTVSSSSVDSLLMTSSLNSAEGLYKEILRHPHISLQPSFESALNLTNRGELAFVWEGIPLDYAATKSDCHLTTIPLGFGKVSYAFALRRGSGFTDVFNRQLLKYRQTGFLEQLTEKYFPQSACQEDEVDDEESYDRLTYSSLSGVFVMIVAASSVSLIILAIEWVAACLADIDRTDPRRPSDFSSALKIRGRRLALDFWDWLPFQNVREHWSKFRPAPEVPADTRI